MRENVCTVFFQRGKFGNSKKRKSRIIFLTTSKLAFFPPWDAFYRVANFFARKKIRERYRSSKSRDKNVRECASDISIPAKKSWKRKKFFPLYIVEGMILRNLWESDMRSSQQIENNLQRMEKKNAARIDFSHEIVHAVFCP